MPDIPILVSFFLATAVFAYVPGPATLYAAAQTLGAGKRAGWMAALGIHVGGYVHVIAAAFGLAIVFKTVPTVYTAFKFVGAACLVWLGVKLFYAKLPISVELDKVHPRRPIKAFARNMAVEILNPKTALFFLAFLLQFTDLAIGMPIWVQLLILGTIVNFMFSSADVLCVILSSKIMRLLGETKSASLWAQEY